MMTSSTTAIADANEVDSRPYDEIDEKIKAAQTWPFDYPESFIKEGKSIRFLYNVTIDVQAKVEFTRIMNFYRDHAFEMHKHCEDKHPYLKEYLEKDPLGIKPVDVGDTRYYENAKHLKAQADAAAKARPQRKKRKKAKHKAKQAAAADATAGDASAAEATTVVRPQPMTINLEEMQEHIPVLTKFAHLLKKVQGELYLILRASIFNFMDDNTTTIMKGIIFRYERDNNIVDAKRLQAPYRYSWERFQRDLIMFCCLKATPGFYFVPLYTTIRKKDQVIVSWCHKIRDIVDKLVKYDPVWKNTTERDAVRRLSLFLSDKDKTIIETDLQNNHVQLWNESNKSMRDFFDTCTLKKVIDVLSSIDAAKFPQHYTPEKHTPAAL